jgi:hypothetical protein
MNSDRRLELAASSKRARKWAAALRRSLSAMNDYCETVEKAKEASERENIAKHGKDWVNRCCG